MILLNQLLQPPFFGLASLQFLPQNAILLGSVLTGPDKMNLPSSKNKTITMLGSHLKLKIISTYDFYIVARFSKSYQSMNTRLESVNWVLLHGNTTATAGTRRSSMINLQVLTLHIKFCSLLGAIGPKMRQKYGQRTRQMYQTTYLSANACRTSSSKIDKKYLKRKQRMMQSKRKTFNGEHIYSKFSNVQQIGLKLTFAFLWF